jgi:hypothetical protein
MPRNQCAGTVRGGNRCSLNTPVGATFCRRHRHQDATAEVEEDGDEGLPLPERSQGTAVPTLTLVERVVSGCGLKDEAAAAVSSWLVAEELVTAPTIRRITMDLLGVTGWKLGWKLALLESAATLTLPAAEGVPSQTAQSPTSSPGTKRSRREEDSDSDDDTGKKRVVKAYVIESQDGVLYQCSSKAEGVRRLRKVRFLTRCMSKERLEFLVEDLAFEPSRVLSLCRMRVESASSLPDSSLGSLDMIWQLYELPCVKVVTKLERVLLGQYQLHDWASLSLCDFVENWSPTSFSQQSASRAGRHALNMAVVNWQKTYSILLDPAFIDVLSPVLAVFDSAAQPLQTFHTFYIAHRIELIFVFWSRDILESLRSELFPAIDLSTPVGCATLLRSYAEVWAAAATGSQLSADVVSSTGVTLPPSLEEGRIVIAETTRRVVNPFELCPHPLFLAGEGSASLIRLPDAGTVRECPRVRDPAVSPRTPAPREKSLCLFAALSLTGVKNRDNDPFACRSESCQYSHPPSREALSAPPFAAEIHTKDKRPARETLKALLRTSLGFPPVKTEKPPFRAPGSKK